MIAEFEMLQESEWWQFDRNLVDQVAFPLGDRYPEEIITRYFSIYGGVVQKFKTKQMMEIGVRYGYTAIVMVAAAQAAGIEYPYYYGIDDESYHAGSCQRANDNLKIAVPGADAHCFKWNSFNGLPPNCGKFDLIHIDGNHETHGVLNDLGHCWPALNRLGFLILDDYYFPEIKAAIHQWLETFVETDEIVAVQFIEDERGHALIRKTGLRKSMERNVERALKGLGLPCSG